MPREVVDSFLFHGNKSALSITLSSSYRIICITRCGKELLFHNTKTIIVCSKQ